MTNHNTHKKSSFRLNILCTLTILGSLFFLFKGFIGYAVLSVSNDDRSTEGIIFVNVTYLLELLSCIGTLAGAIIMLNGRKVGLTIYIISTILFIVLTTFFAFFCFLTLVGIPIGLLQFIYLVPCVLFLILYKNQEKHLS
jgi:hypothetical protein